MSRPVFHDAVVGAAGLGAAGAGAVMAKHLTGRETVRLSADGFRSARAAMADAGEAVRLALYQQAQRCYIARHLADGARPAPGCPCRSGRRRPRSSPSYGATSATGQAGAAATRYRDVLARLETATGPVTLDLPGHVLSITEAGAGGR